MNKEQIKQSKKLIQKFVENRFEGKVQVKFEDCFTFRIQKVGPRHKQYLADWRKLKPILQDLTNKSRFQHLDKFKIKYPNSLYGVDWITIGDNASNAEQRAKMFWKNIWKALLIVPETIEYEGNTFLIT
jgi:hypothetical protein